MLEETAPTHTPFIPSAFPHPTSSARQEQLKEQLEVSKSALLNAAASMCEAILRNAAQRRQQQREFFKQMLDDIYMS